MKNLILSSFALSFLFSLAVKAESQFEDKDYSKWNHIALHYVNQSYDADSDFERSGARLSGQFFASDGLFLNAESTAVSDDSSYETSTIGHVDFALGNVFSQHNGFHIYPMIGITTQTYEWDSGSYGGDVTHRTWLLGAGARYEFSSNFYANIELRRYNEYFGDENEAALSTNLTFSYQFQNELALTATYKDLDLGIDTTSIGVAYYF